MQVVLIRLGGHGAVGIDVFAGRDKTHGVGATGEWLDVLAHGAQAYQGGLAESQLEQLGGQRTAAALGKALEHFIAHGDMALGLVFDSVGISMELGHCCSPGRLSRRLGQ
ncbi:hypothetical protein D3C75_1135800 [compost metagenome]